MYKEINQCRVCGNRNLVPILNLGTQALASVFPKRKDQPVAAAPLELVKCQGEGGDVCGLVQLRHSFRSQEIYTEHYGYRSNLNQTIVRHLQGRVREILDRISLRDGDVIVDIGSNDGTLLSFYPEGRFQLIGVDPAAERFRDRYPSDAKLLADFFSSDKIFSYLKGQKAKAITSIAMFYDLESPLDFMRQISDVLDDNGIWVFEQSYLPAMLSRNAYDTICHEHLEYYCLKQIQWMTKRSGLKILDIEFNEINGGSFCVTTAKDESPFAENTPLIRAVLEQEESLGLATLIPFMEFKQRIEQHSCELREFIQGIHRAHKTIIGYGASTKGNVLLQFCGFTDQDIPCIAEVNEEKFGCFCPGTHIPIISEKEAREKCPDYFFVLPWHFKENFLSREKKFLAAGGKFLMPLPDVEAI